MIGDLAATMAALEAVMVPEPLAERPTGIKVGVDLGTAYTVLIALDADDRPLAAVYEFADVVRDGVVTDFVGAIDLVRRLKRKAELRLGVPILAAHGAYPPGVARSEVRAVQHVIEAAEMECTGLVDEPTAANAVLRLRDGIVVDVGGGTTGVAVVQDGVVVHTADEPTGGTHLTLVIAGALGISFDEAEALKKDPQQQSRLFPLIRPVMEKVASILTTATRGWPTPMAYLVGGTASFPGFAEVVTEASGIDTVVPVAPLFVTPLGIARNGAVHAPSYGSTELGMVPR
ncbi:ethanolamine utilization protein EutJ [Cellulomonas sp. KRMCY2]|uniref:ethanolamine utilization protein EutJ n=1 Tax=Cellulomonas sp. KRMCY2 TaxID=1304865 RepID=UPI00045E73B9|nr:ethanolamine utilization protein EutJ [Cellulomonas sp. KRMCY2]